jgi:hypothetical protein
MKEKSTKKEEKTKGVKRKITLIKEESQKKKVTYIFTLQKVFFIFKF